VHIARQRKPSIRIEMSPLVDCIFLLLIFFLLSSTFLTPKIQLALPKAGSAASSSENDAVVVTIDAGGQAYLNSRPTTWAELDVVLNTRLRKADRKVVTLRCDESTPHRYFVRALETAKASGAMQVNITHEVEQANEP
jgi:biopolymer transport protein ExbD